jgi:uncharacterized protein (DUF885 family)
MFAAMKYSLMAVLLIVLCSLAVVGRASPPPAPGDDAAYRQFSDHFFAGHFAWRPLSGVSLGLHEYDGKSPNFTRDSIDQERARLRQAQDVLRALDQKTLSADVWRESRGLLASIESELLGFEVMRTYERNPMTYASAYDLTGYAKRNFAPKPQRLRAVVQILQQVPAGMNAGRANLEARLPKVWITTAIEQANGMADFFSGELVEAFADLKDESLQSDFTRARTAAAAAMKDFAAWLKSEKLPNASDDFAIGADAYRRMLADEELIAMAPDDVLQIAERELKREQDRFAAAARQIDASKPAIVVYKSIQKDHPTEQSLIPDTVKHLEMIRQFLVERRLVSFPSDVRVKVDLTPKFERATSFASMDSPGPFEQVATEAFYYVTPTEPEWDAKRKEEWLTAFNFYATDVTSIHEAYPGHYVQSLHLKASPASRIDKAFGSYAFVEGWAHYSEQMVIDEGFPAGADPITAAKYRLEQSDEALLRLCRLVASLRMHTKGMSVQEATKFFMDNCYYEEAPARSEAERGTYDPGYGFYTLGKLQILKLREDWKKQEGDKFNLQRFHDELLKHGQPPIRLLREVMLKDEKLWDEAL